jgi:hypothetical protein
MGRAHRERIVRDESSIAHQSVTQIGRRDSRRPQKGILSQ